MLLDFIIPKKINYFTIFVSACRGLMELGGRLIECLPSFFLKYRNLYFLPMDSWAAFSFGGFVAGWLARDWSLRAPEIPICRCECNVGSNPVVTDQSLVSGNSLLILLGVIGLVIALSNTALAFKVTYRDSETGQGREFAFDVKGKSKGQLGVFGSGKGIADHQLIDGSGCGILGIRRLWRSATCDSCTVDFGSCDWANLCYIDP